MFEAVFETGTSPAEKAEPERKRHRVYTHPCYAYWAVCHSWQSQAVSGSQNVREWVYSDGDIIIIIIIIIIIGFLV